jgi:hypothetical protein
VSVTFSKVECTHPHLGLSDDFTDVLDDQGTGGHVLLHLESPAHLALLQPQPEARAVKQPDNNESNTRTVKGRDACEVK